MRPIIGTSWKMNLTARQAADYLDILVPLVADIDDRDLFVLPSFPVIFVARDRLTGTNLSWGAQDVHPDDSGAHTGDVSAPMLADLGVRFVEVGHAERRRDHGEVPALIAAKVGAVLRWGMSPIICIGEQSRRGADAAMAELLPDLERLLADVTSVDPGRLVIAYEPVWAIGDAGTPASPEEVAVIHRAIHRWLEDRFPDGAGARVIYGGSVDAVVAAELLRQPGVDGLFVGRAALDPARFATIARTPIRSPLAGKAS